jgi:mRNA interferase HigB
MPYIRSHFAAASWGGRAEPDSQRQSCSHGGSAISFPVRIIAKRTLRQFWESSPRHADARQPLQAWFREVSRATWRTPADVKAQYRSASVLQDGRVVFNVAGNKYRVVVWIRYVSHTVYVRFVGTHEQYDAIDVQTV